MKTFVGLLFFSVVTLAQTHAPATRHQGSEPYTPTKREWLVLCLAEDKALFDSGNTGEVQFTFSAAKDDPETINVLVAYAKSATKDAVDNAFVFATSRIRDRAAEHGWDWVKVRKSEMALPEQDHLKKPSDSGPKSD